MKIIVLLKQAPDLVEDLEVDDSGLKLDFEFLKLKLNEFDEHALEEALLIKESESAEVVAVAIDGDDVERLLFTALAKGVDKAVKITGADPFSDNHVLSTVFAAALKPMSGDLILTGVQSVSDRDGQLGPLLAARLGIPAVSVVTGVEVSGNTITLKKEYSGGMMAEFEADLPIVLGIQAARQSPRYAPVSKVRQIQQSATIDSIAATDGGESLSTVTALEPPPKGQGAEMLGGAEDLVNLLKEKGVI